MSTYPPRIYAIQTPVLFPLDDVQPCRGDARFTSERWADHLAIRDVCFNDCPASSFNACQELAKAEGRNAHGTYAGIGYGIRREREVA